MLEVGKGMNDLILSESIDFTYIYTVSTFGDMFFL